MILPPSMSYSTAPAKLIVIIGITGNQGSSVASTFLSDPRWKIRGLTRNPDSAASKALSEKGVQMVVADLHDPVSLKDVFNGANLIFSVTDFWTPYLDPVNQAKATEQGKSIGRFAYELEREQGRNIADAVARVVEGLDEVGFVASTLSHAGKCSKGKYKELWHFDAKADVFPGYVEEKYPELARKSSWLQTGYFFSSWRILDCWLGRMPDGSRQMRFPTSPSTIVPHLDARKDTGPFVKALLLLPAGKTVMAASEWCTWPDWIKTWGEVVGVPDCSYKQVTVGDLDKWYPGGIGKEIGEMYEYSNDPGYDGGEPEVLRTADLKKMGIEVRATSLRDYVRSEDWSGVLAAC
ncbi:hypothetical protein BCR34DRAFT_570901 [Clohesyomyces aquaticus]|uniref:NmrA-like domain-containing protein n=1 Tax=Clohesyomyces aquaticus TaxID=1231657 RepID=A0A1Y1Z9S7_9PLEO|nr:hypothetical protein BCR34DRAFT_570901 [Clohesyomyces aquaticus]